MASISTSGTSVYDAQRGGLDNPDLIVVGQPFELVTTSDGSRYLRLIIRPASPSTSSRTAAVAPAAREPIAAPVAPVAAAVPLASVPGAADTLVLGVLPNVSAATLLSQSIRPGTKSGIWMRPSGPSSRPLARLSPDTNSPVDCL